LQSTYTKIERVTGTHALTNTHCASLDKIVLLFRNVAKTDSQTDRLNNQPTN